MWGTTTEEGLTGGREGRSVAEVKDRANELQEEKEDETVLELGGIGFLQKY